MSFEVYLLHLEDIHRLLTHSQVPLLILQPICVQILSSEESELQSPTVGSNDPTWKRPYSFLCSEREKLLFIVKSLDDRTYLEPICSGYLNLAAKPPHSWNNVKTSKISLTNRSRDGWTLPKRSRTHDRDQVARETHESGRGAEGDGERGEQGVLGVLAGGIEKEGGAQIDVLPGLMPDSQPVQLPR